MINIKDKSKCSGCTACMNKCPKDAIYMQEDENGFKYPIVDKEKCIECGLCERICPVLNNKNVLNKPKAFACTNSDEEIRKNSSSGGVFTLIANYIIKRNGVVFGAAYDEEFDLKHIYVEKEKDLYKLRTSKYLQSYIGDMYKKAKSFLDEKRLVLFTGTPCQIEGLKAFLGKEYENLYTQDIICHGVPSPKVWRKYKEFRKIKDNDKPLNINFRNKDNGWHKFNLKFDYAEKSYYKNQTEDIYMKAFLSDLCLRDSCYACSFKKYNRLSDITLADFWGIETLKPELDDNKGLSLVIVNSDKGNNLLNSVKDNCAIFEEVDINAAIERNKSFIKSVHKNKYRQAFFDELDQQEFDYLVKKYVKKAPFIKRVLGKVKRIVKKIIKR